MASMSFLQRGENVTLHATFPPKLPGRLYDWTVTSIVGELPDVDPAEYARWFEGLPERIETISILNTLLFQHLVKVLLLVWILALWYRLQNVRCRAAAHDRIQVRERYLVDAGFAAAGLLLASNGWLKSCVLLLACWATFYEAPVDAAGMLLVFFAFVFGRDMQMFVRAEYSKTFLAFFFCIIRLSPKIAARLL